MMLLEDPDLSGNRKNLSQRRKARKGKTEKILGVLCAFAREKKY
jgi:hypothetical protein